MKINRNKFSNFFPVLEQIILYTAYNVDYNIPIQEAWKQEGEHANELDQNLDVCWKVMRIEHFISYC